jgi:diadenosine tetraphosphate (Ap4A) HIT family hydrolase
MATRGWPDDWEERKQGRDCPLCAVLGNGDDDHAVAVAQLPHTEVRLERRSRVLGYCIVVWRHGHVAEPTALEPDAAHGYWDDVMTVSRALELLYQPVKMNFFTLGNWVPHLHTHVVPRYLDDPAPGGPITFDAIFADDSTPPDELRQQAAAIRAALATPSS